MKFYIEESFNNRTNFYDVGYRFIPRYWGKGYATESAKAVLNYAFNILNIETVVGMADVKNVASNIVLKKIGLKYIEDFSYKDQMVAWYELKNVDYE